SYSDETRTGINILGRFTPEVGSSIVQDHFQAAISLKSILSPTFFNEARVLYSDSNGTQTANSDDPGVERPGGIYGGDDLNLREQDEVQFQFVDNITWIKGNHTLKFGVDVTRVDVDVATEFNPNGTFVYTTDDPFEGGDSGLGHKGLSAAARGIGVPDVDDDGDGIIDEERILETYPLFYRLLEGKPSVSVADTVLAAFVQDEWHVRDNVTLNVGLRYDLESFELDERHSVESAIDNGGADNDTDNLAPRFSFSWLPMGSGKVLLRGGIGVFYDKLVLGFPAIAAITSGQTIRLGFFQGLGFPCTEDFLAEVGAEVFRAACGLGALNIEALSLHFSTGDTLDTPYTVQANLGFDYSFGDGMLFGLNYVHARGHHIPLFRDLNPIHDEDVVPGLPLHLDTTVGSIVAIETMGNSWYDALQAQLRRTRGRVRYTVSYTYSKAEDEGSDPLMNRATLPPSFFDLQGKRIPASERARSDSDRRHRLVVSGTWDTPWWGLKISPVINYRSGAPFNVTLGIDDNAVNLEGVDTQGRLLPDGFAQERPAGLGRNTGANTPISLVNQVREEWCNDTVMVDGNAEPTEQLATPCLPAYDGTLQEQDFIQVDLRVGKAFDMGDSQLEAFVQIFNIFNRANRGFVDGAINSRNFGKPLTLMGPPRIVEMGVRFGF
ncbi:MAG: TonB-dependent receptor, partial [Dehalococcoidia bacterium]